MGIGAATTGWPVAALCRAALLLGIGLIMLWWTWGKLGDPYIDFGKELHVAWRISEGAVLYRDVQYLYGPLSCWINGACFALFGAGIRTLVLCNAAVLALTTALLYRILRRFAGPLSATVAAALFLLLFAFGNFVGFSNYNYLTPYAHGLTHGIALLLIGTWGALRWLERPHFGWAGLTGAALGLSVFTKPEIFLAGAVTLGGSMLVMLCMRGDRRGQRAGAALAFAASAAGVVVVILASMTMTRSGEQTLRGVFASYLFALDEPIAQTRFYRVGLGTDHVPRSLNKAAVWAAHYGQIFIPAAIVALLISRWSLHGRSRRAKVRGWVLVAAVGVIAFSAIWQLRWQIRWTDAFRGLIGVVAAIDVILLFALVAAYRSRRDVRVSAAMVAFALLATALLAKMALNVRIYQYGFVLAMPCVLLVSIVLLEWVPRLLTRAGGDGRIFAAAVGGTLAAVVAVHLQFTSQNLRSKDIRLNGGADLIFASGETGRMMRQALEELRLRVAPGDTLAALPEGAMFNYLLRVKNATPFDQLTPIGARVFGEDRITRAFVQHPPDWMVLVHQDTSIFGARYLGSDYLPELGHWIDAHYVEVWRVGAAPLEDLNFGISIRRRRAE